MIAAHVFGSENVMGIAMPSPYSSEGSVADARKLAHNLKIGFQVKDITKVYNAIKKLFLFGGMPEFSNPVTDENIQPRVRADILGVYSNDNDPCLWLTTGNKSEMTVGYCTIYGDMCGGLGVISDVWKLDIYRLAKFFNMYFDDPIPEDTVSKPASAELRKDQKDIDTLPPYEILDPLLRMFVEKEMTPMDVFASQWFKTHIPGMDSGRVGPNHVTSAIVNVMYRLYRNAEYKRQQMPVGCKLSKRSYGSGRRMPIACKITSL